MDAREPTADDLARARADQDRRGDERDARRTQSWHEQAEQIQDDMSDAVERAQAMGDHVEPSLLPDQRRADETPARERNSAGDPDGIGYDRTSGNAQGPSDPKAGRRAEA